MSKNNVFLNIRSFYNGEETLSLFCDGEIAEKDGGYRISWEGSEFIGEEGKENSVEVYGDKSFHFNLGGSDNASLFLEKDKTCVVADYEMGFPQKIPVQFYLTELKNNLSENYGNVSVEYSITNPYTPAVKKRLEISVL